MKAKYLPPIREPTPVGDDFAAARSPLLASRACCCPARPVVRVIMPPTATRRHPVDLLLCGHHCRVSCQALAEPHATVTELTEVTDARPPARLPGVPAPRVCAG